MTRRRGGILRCAPERLLVYPFHMFRWELPGQRGTVTAVFAVALAYFTAACGSEDEPPPPAPAGTGGESGRPPIRPGVGIPGDDDAGEDPAGDAADAGAEETDAGVFTPPDPSEVGIADFSSGIDEDRALNTLGEGEIAALCGELFSYELTVLPRELAEPALCLLMVLMMAPASEAECRMLVDDCMVQTEFIEEPGECELTLDMLSTCPATVREFEACATESAAMGRWFFELLDCALLAEMSADEIPSDTSEMPMPACDALRERCPKLFD